MSRKCKLTFRAYNSVFVLNFNKNTQLSNQSIVTMTFPVLLIFSTQHSSLRRLFMKFKSLLFKVNWPWFEEKYTICNNTLAWEIICLYCDKVKKFWFKHIFIDNRRTVVWLYQLLIKKCCVRIMQSKFVSCHQIHRQGQHDAWVVRNFHGHWCF